MFTEDQNSFIQVEELQGPDQKNSEALYLEQKERIKSTKVRNEQKRNDQPIKSAAPKQIFNGILSVMDLNEHYYWETSKFDYESMENEYIPNISENFEACAALQQYPLSKSFEIRNMTLRTVNEIDYETQGIEVNVSVALKGESHFWIFTRAFVNKDYNESIAFDTQSQYNMSGDIFNKYSTIIRISKEDKSLRCFAYFGAFCEENNSGLAFKTFCRRQLIDHSRKDQKNHMDNDTCEFNISLIDIGDEVITSKIKMNDSDTNNDIKGTFYIPTNKRAKIMFGGAGQSVLIKSLKCIPFFKDGSGIQFSSEKKTCNCCSIF